MSIRRTVHPIVIRMYNEYMQQTYKSAYAAISSQKISLTDILLPDIGKLFFMKSHFFSYFLLNINQRRCFDGFGVMCAVFCF